MYDTEQTLAPVTRKSSSDTPLCVPVALPPLWMGPFPVNAVRWDRQVLMAVLPVVYREAPVPVTTPVIPLNFVYPGLSLAQLMAIVWAYRKLTILIVLAGLLLTITVMSMWPRTYTAMVRLMVSYEVNDPLNGKELPVGQVGSYIATEMELMQTPEVLLAVVDRLDLTRHKDYAAGYDSRRGTLREWAAGKLARNLAVYQGQFGSQLIYVTYSARDPAEAAQVANSIADVYREHDYVRSTGPPGRRAERYAEQLQELKAKVDQAQKEVTAFHQRNTLIDEGDKTHVDMVLLATLEGRLLDAQNERRAAQARASGNQAVSDLVLSSPEVQALKAQLATQELRLAELNWTYMPNHPDILEQQNLTQATRRSLASALGSYSANAAAGLGMARNLERSLQQAVAEQRSKVLATSQLHDEAAKYLLELDSTQVVYRRALEGYDQFMFASGGHYTNVTLVSRATPPVKASKPRVFAGLLLGGFTAFALGLGIPLGYELFNRRVRCRDDLERHHGIPVLIELGRLPSRFAA